MEIAQHHGPISMERYHDIRLYLMKVSPAASLLEHTDSSPPAPSPLSSRLDHTGPSPPGLYWPFPSCSLAPPSQSKLPPNPLPPSSHPGLRYPTAPPGPPAGGTGDCLQDDLCGRGRQPPPVATGGSGDPLLPRPHLPDCQVALHPHLAEITPTPVTCNSGDQSAGSCSRSCQRRVVPSRNLVLPCRPHPHQQTAMTSWSRPDQGTHHQGGSQGC